MKKTDLERIADDYPTGDNLTDEVITGGFSTQGDLTEDVLTAGSPTRADELDADSLGLIERGKERGSLDDERLMDDDKSTGEEQPETT